MKSMFFLLLFSVFAQASVVDTINAGTQKTDSVSLLIKANCPSNLPVAVVRKILTHESKSFYAQNAQPWPWTLNINGKGHYYDSIEDAVTAAQQALDSGARRLGVGLGQIEWSYHAGRFDNDIAMSLDPARNVSVVCDILEEGFNDSRVQTVRDLIAYYHRPVLDDTGYGYAEKVLAL